MSEFLQRLWYERAQAPLGLRPLAALYGFIANRRRERLVAQQKTLPLPVIVVGNISVGGTGKTPFSIWLVERLREWGFSPGVISRGYGGKASHYPLRVRADSDPAHCGDEPLLIALRTGAPVVVAPDRLAAARLLIDSGEVDVLIADDGLQHYRLPRQLEFCVIDGARGLGNRALIPAGPLREPPARLDEVDFVVVNGAGFDERPDALRFQLQALQTRSLVGAAERPLASWHGETVHAVAGIGHPQRFFASLRAAGLQLIEHAFADHHRFFAQDLRFGDALPVLMTEKDAVKCRAFADERAWALPVSAQLSAADEARVRVSCMALRSAAQAAPCQTR
ncbi:tetraacyldisaccharide 4'-kinase [Hydrocarboniphaga effusa]|uniref:tetraacyldisaccharide 4'-kinase n=1 Tax=Hydrocarboniphaga effusa TaxID=243629 RepID=UPI00398BBEF2